MTLGSISRSLVALVLCFVSAAVVFAQSDLERKTIAVTYPLDETVVVKFRERLCFHVLRARRR
jgi:hypothetical protein